MNTREQEIKNTTLESYLVTIDNPMFPQVRVITPPLYLRYATLNSKEESALAKLKFSSAIELAMNTDLEIVTFVPIQIQEIVKPEFFDFVKKHLGSAFFKRIILAGTPNVAGLFPLLDLRETVSKYQEVGINFGLSGVNDTHNARNTLVAGMSLVIPSNPREGAFQRMKSKAIALGIQLVEPQHVLVGAF